MKNICRLPAILLLSMLALPAAAGDLPSEAESQRYFFSLMQKAQSFRVPAGAAPGYLRGVWRLDRKAHIGDGHYARADRGDDVTLICNDERLIQIDFNRHNDRFIEFSAQLSSLTPGDDGSMHFGQGKRHLKPLDENHLAVTRYDYIVVLERVSGVRKPDEQMAFPVDE